MNKPKIRRPRNQKAKLREEVMSEMHQQMALDKFQAERPQLWLQSQRVMKLVEVQAELANDEFPEGSCFVHASTVGFASFCVKKVIGIDLDTCQVTVEIYGDEHLEAGVVVLPLESIEWFGFPAKAVPTGIHFEGFTHHVTPQKSEPAQKVVEAAPGKRGKGKVEDKPAALDLPQP
jgi:hypothetical protein